MLSMCNGALNSKEPEVRGTAVFYVAKKLRGDTSPYDVCNMGKY
jgi:hypothetical protein